MIFFEFEVMTKLYDLLKTALEVSSVRKDVISNNLSNINTKNFKRSSVKFEEFLNSKVKRASLKTTNEKHILLKNESYEIVKDKGTSMRSDGNNVDIDIEKANQASNTLMYNALISSINNKFQLASLAINRG